MRDFSRILDRRAGDAPRYRSSGWRRAFDGNPAFAPLVERTWPHRGAEGPEVVLTRAASVSFVAALDDARAPSCWPRSRTCSTRTPTRAAATT